MKESIKILYMNTFYNKILQKFRSNKISPVIFSKETP